MSRCKSSRLQSTKISCVPFILFGFGAGAAVVPLMGGCAQPAYVTTGGAQDVASARAVIESGGIPEPESITVEGFLSEHSIPAPAPDGAGLLYATSAVAWHQDFDGFTPLATVQIGFGTTLDLENFRRDPLNLCLVIDRSASMADSIDERTRTSKLNAVKVAVDRLLARLNAEDRVSVVTFNEGASVRLEASAGDDGIAVKTVLDGIEPVGGTELVQGLSLGYQTVRANRGEGRSDRLFVFTDALLADWDERLLRRFFGVIEDNAEQNIGVTFLGVGSDFGHEIAFDISQQRGGNYFFLSDYDRIVNIFDDGFDLLVTPVAYDVELTVSIPFEFDMAEVYGIPVSGALPHVFELTVPTLFLSEQEGGGAIFLRARAGALVDFNRENMLAEVAFSYVTPEGEKQALPTLRSVLPAGLDPDAAEGYFENDAVKRGVLLLNTVLTLKRACEDLYGTEGRGYYYYDPTARDRALARLGEFVEYFEQMAMGLEDATSESSRTLSEERALIGKLRDNIFNEY